MLNEKIRKAQEHLKSELEEEKLQRIDKDMRNSILQLTEDSRKLLKEAPSDVEKLLLQEEESLLKRTLLAIDSLRLEKILTTVLSRRQSPDMTEREAAVYEALVSSLKEAERVAEEEMPRKRLATILGKIPAFVGIDGREYGPFKPGDLATLEEQDYEALGKEGLVKETEVEV